MSVQVLMGKILLYRDSNGAVEFMVIIPVVTPITSLIERLKQDGCHHFVVIDADLSYFKS